MPREGAPLLMSGGELFPTGIFAHAYDIDLTGVKMLKLLTEDGGDGKGADWGLWLAPTIGR